MSEQRSTPGQADASRGGRADERGGERGDGSGDEGLLALTGLASYLELAAFGLLAGRSVDAPDLATRQALGTAAGEVLGRQERLLGLATSRGRDPVATMAPFDGVLADFDARTAPDSWSEGLLKGVVGHGVAQDLCRELASGLPARDAADLRRAAKVGVAAPTGHGDRGDAGQDVDAPATVVLAQAVAQDAVLASRLALWGRRVVGEALGLVPVLLGAHPVLADLAERAAAASAPSGGDADAAGDVRAWLMSRLTAEHTRRMDRMGLAA